MTCFISGVRVRPLASLFTLFSLLSWAVADDIQVNVDCAQVVDRPLVLTGYFNNSLRNEHLQTKKSTVMSEFIDALLGFA
jgi:hypothetical protein